jgi:CTP synthase
LTHANSAEFKPENDQNVIDLMDSQKGVKDLGGTMRLGAYPCRIKSSVKGKTTHAFAAYQTELISERHRHRFEVSNAFRGRLEEGGLVVSGLNSHPKTSEELVEMIELPEHPWFLGCQFHPELLSRPLEPHPLFVGFIKASLNAKGKS